MERLNKIFAEWAKDDKKTELKSEKVELARKAPSVEKDFQKLDVKLQKAEDKIDKAFTTYKKIGRNFNQA